MGAEKSISLVGRLFTPRPKWLAAMLRSSRLAPKKAVGVEKGQPPTAAPLASLIGASKGNCAFFRPDSASDYEEF